jgi:hypothetical protein
MKNKYKQVVITLILFLSINGYSQNTELTSKIQAVGRYVPGTGVELRFFPDRKATLNLGLKDGFYIERSIGITDDFTRIATIQPFSSAQWEEVLSLHSQNQDLELAKDFYDNLEISSGGNFDFEEGIASLKEQKAAEDFEYMVFLLTAIKDKFVAEALGLSYIDATAIEGETYQYRVKLVAKSNLYTIENVPYRITAEANDSQYKNKVYTKTGDKELSFIWLETPELSGYYVERANPGETEFVRLNKAPIYTLTGKGFEGDKRSGYNDEGLENYKTYTYRFFGNTPFGEEVQFAEVKAMPKDLTPPNQPFLKQPQHVKPNEVLVSWEMNGNLDPDLKGFVIARSDKNKGDFTVIHSNLLSPEIRSFSDTTFIKGQTNYYVVQVLDTSNNISSSFPVSVTLIDSVPPSQPKFISGEIDSLGVITLDIELNKEEDLMGYRLFFANDDFHEFSVIREGFNHLDSMENPVQIQFLDTVSINTLTPYVYYRIKALDYNYNQSKFSEILKVKRPDTISPTTPVFKRVKVRMHEVELHFALSRSKDVVEQMMYRKINFEDGWEPLVILANSDTKYIDTNVIQGTVYTYSLRAKDDSENYSDFSVSVSGKPFDNGVRPVVVDIEMSVEENKVTMQWEYPENYSDIFFIIYKKDKHGTIREFRKVNKKLFIQTLPAGDHEYGIKAFTKDGGQSKISEIIKVNID